MGFIRELVLECLDRDSCLLCAGRTQPSWRRKFYAAPLAPDAVAKAYPLARPSSVEELIEELQNNLCSACLARWPLRLRRESALSSKALPEVRVLFPYAGEVKEAFLRYKFSLERRWAVVLAALAFYELRSFLPPQALLCPMPGTAKRNRYRGFNPPGLIVHYLQASGYYRSIEGLLKREVEGPYQHELPNREARLQNMLSGLSVDSQLAEQFRAERIYIVDDIVTSGASLTAAERVCTEAGLDCRLIALAGGADFYCYEGLSGQSMDSARFHFQAEL